MDRHRPARPRATVRPPRHLLTAAQARSPPHPIAPVFFTLRFSLRPKTVRITQIPPAIPGVSHHREPRRASPSRHNRGHVPGVGVFTAGPLPPHPAYLKDASLSTPSRRQPRRSHDHRREANSYTPSVHTELWKATIRRTTVFESGNSRAVRLPKDFQIADREVQIFRQGTDIVIRAIPKTIGEALSLLPPCPDDMFTEPRDGPPPPQRDWWNR